ncbi:MAG: tyrosine-type recombinase/integrase [Thermoanaerobaculia bacterium]|nr:tyrosine-type recombinase/integrase [Thermoanaerobaculia bacterium]
MREKSDLEAAPRGSQLAAASPAALERLELPEPPSSAEALLAYFFRRQRQPATALAYRDGLVWFARWLVERRIEVALPATGRTLAQHRRTRAERRSEEDALLVRMAEALLTLRREQGVYVLEEFGRALEAYRGPRRRKLAAATVNRLLAGVAAFVRTANQVGLLAWRFERGDVPYRSIPARARRARTRGPHPSAYRLILGAAAAEASPRAERDLAILRLAGDLGLRRREIHQLDLDDVEEGKAGRMTLSVTRKGETEQIPLTVPAPTAAVLRAWVALRGDAPGPLLVSLENEDHPGTGEGSRPGRRRGRPPADPSEINEAGLRRIPYSTLYAIVRRYSERVGEPTRPHGLRHMALSEAMGYAARKGWPLSKVLEFSGHSPRSVAILFDYADEFEDAQGQLAEMVARGHDE